MILKGKYSIDAPRVFTSYVLLSVIFIIWGIISIMNNYKFKYIISFFALLSIFFCIIFLHTTRRGKFNIWNNVVDTINIDSNIKYLDLGCGRGAILYLIVKRLDFINKGMGIDLWKNNDQYENNIEKTKENAIAEGVENKIELITADMMKLPFRNESFDLITSNLAIHNIKDKNGRRKALEEAYRVLKENGELIIVDIGNIKEYKLIFEELRLKDIIYKNTGYNGWWPGPWMPTYLIRGKK